MFKKLLWFFLFPGISFLASAGPATEPGKTKVPSTTTSRAEKVLEEFNQGAFSLNSFGFMENKGQILGPDGSVFPEAKFEFQQGNTKIFLLEKGIAYQFTKTHYPEGYLDLLKKKDGAKDLLELEKLRKQIKTETYRMDMSFLGANAHAEIIKEGQSTDATHYYNLNVLDVHSYDKITYKEIYPGIDWVIYIKGKELKYDFVVKPGADPYQIKMQFLNQEKLGLNADGSFTLKNSLGEIKEKAPLSFQEEEEITSAFKLNKTTLSFELGNYNKNKSLVIDPSVLWATYYGDANDDISWSCAIDPSGNVYLAGYTNSGSSIASGGQQNTYGGGSWDAFLVKFNSVGVRQWATYYGGSDLEQCYSCATDGSGNVYIAGSTSSTNSIASGGHQNSYGLSQDAFLAKYNGAGVLQWATYYGGDGGESWSTCSTDITGNVYLCGMTSSTASIASGGFQNSLNTASGCSNFNAYLVKFNSSGVRQWGTYYGGGCDYGYSCAADPSGNVYLEGVTGSTVSIASGGHQNSFGGGGWDNFLVKFNSSGTRLWGTYYGGPGNESNNQFSSSCATDASGNVYISSLTESTISIASGGHQNSYGGGAYDAYLVKFNSSGVRQWATYYGGSGDEERLSCAIDANNNVYLSGLTGSPNSIASGGFQNVYGGGVSDAFLVKFDPSGIRQWGSYYGGAGDDASQDCASNYSGNVYLTGWTNSAAGIASGGHQNTYGGNFDAFLVKFCDIPAQPVSITGSTISCSGSQSYSVTNDLSATSYSWTYSGSAVGSSTVNSINLTCSSSGVLSVMAINACGTSVSQTINITVEVTPTISVNSGSICLGNSFVINPSGAFTYTISGGSATVSPSSDTSYSVTGTSSAGCVSGNTAISNVTVITTPFLSINTTGQNICSGQTTTLTGLGAATYSWVSGPNTDTYAVTPSVSTSYTLFATSVVGCTNSMAVPITVSTSPVLTITASSTLICPANTSTLTGSGANTYTWITGPSTATYAVNPATTTTYTLTGTAINGCTNVATSQVSVYAAPSISISPSSTVLCFGNTATLTASGAITYTWSGGGPNTSTYAVTPNITSNFTVFGTSAAGCTNSAVQQVSVIATPTINISASSTLICPAQGATLSASGASTYTWVAGPTSSTYAVNPTVTTTYTVNGTAVNGCTSSATRQVSLNSIPVLTITASPTLICSGNSSTLTGLGATNYTWSGGPNTDTFVVSPTLTTTYTLIGESAAGCTTNATRQVSVNATPIPSITPSSTVLCSGFSVTLSASGASTFTWTSGPVSNSFVVSPTVTTTYTVTGTTNNCTNTAVQSISVNTTPVLTITPSSTVICTGNSSTLVATGATTYTWSGGPVFPSYTVSPATTTNYTVTGTAGNGCTNTAQQSVSVNITPTITIVPTATVTCANVSQTLTAGGANTYTWSGGPTTSAYVISPTVNSTYTVTGTAVNGCTNTNTQSMSVIALPVITITPSSSVICSGFTSTLTASGANTYSWVAGPNTTTFAVTPSVTTAYTVNATAVTGCSNSAVGSVSVNATPTLVITPSNTLYCIGTPYVMTGSGAATYSWVGGPTTASYSVNPAVTTVYSLDAASAAGCLSSAQYTVVFNAPPVLTITPSSTVICSNKTATFTGTGANTYTWVSGPATDSYVIVNPPVSSTYTLIGTAVNGCTAFATQNLSVNPAPVLTITPSSSVICSWNTATLTVSGAVTHSWTGGPVSPIYTVSPFSTTNYTATGTAANGCTSSAVQIVSIITTPALTVTASSTLICSGESTTLSASGASTYTWSGGPVSPSYPVSPSVTTNYALIATSANGCTLAAVKTISVNATPVLTIVPSNSVICSNISSTLVALGASNFTWSGGPINSTYVVSPTVTSSYSVTGSTNGCSNTAVQTVSVNSAPVLSISPSNPVVCVGNSITLTGSGANTYTWSTGSNSPSISVSPSLSTSYTLYGTASSAGGCSNTAVTNLTVNPSPVISVNSGSICEGNTFTISPSGAASYSISGGSWMVSPTVTSFYTVTATSTLGCLSLNSPVSTVIVHPRPTLTVNSGSICPGGVFVIQPSGASTYTYSSGSPTVYPLVNSTYSVTGTSSLGCASSNTALSQVVILPTPTIVVSNGSICIGGSFVISPSGAATYTYSSGSPTVNPVTTSTYYVAGSNAVGCASSNTPAVLVTVFQNPTISVNSGTVCLGGSMVLTAGGANSYSWNTGAGSASITVSPTVLTNYTVTGTDLNSCSASASSTVVVVPQLSVNIAASSPTLCQGGTTTLTAFGANNFTWSTGSTSPSIVANLSVTTSYSVFGASGAACTNTAAQVVTVIPLPVITIGGQGFGCAGFSFTLIANGANTYTWNTSATGSVLVVSPSSSTGYTVTGSNGFNCTNTSSIFVNVSTPVTPSICMVTVDSIGMNNEIFWDKSLFPEADTFIVYRQTNFGPNPYTPLIRLHKNAASSYLDTSRFGAYNGDPNTTSYKYKLQYRDTCGNLSSMSSYHETVHVQDQQNGNFSWNPYFVEWGGAISVGYILVRYNVLTGITSTVGQSGGTNYTDQNYAAVAATGNTKWYVYVDGFSCNVNQSSKGFSTAAVKTRTKSNNTNEKQFPGGNGSPTKLEEQFLLIGNVQLYPNPASDELIIHSRGEFHQVLLRVSDLTGRVVLEQGIEGTLFKLNTRNLVNGSYFVSLLPEGKPGRTFKVIIQH